MAACRFVESGARTGDESDRTVKTRPRGREESTELPVVAERSCRACCGGVHGRYLQRKAVGRIALWIGDVDSGCGGFDNPRPFGRPVRRRSAGT
ncbi:MAG: hypothetical protein D6725_04395 [Planctomycetota bacterium]|nr:MAG: hypothetical protein D6725_04395 [Planctomycetota bacterium]